MKKAKLPLPILVLISATLFLFSSSFGEWIGRPATALRSAPPENVEQQQAAIDYVRVMSWLARVVAHPAARAEEKPESAQMADPPKTPTRGVTLHKLQLCALSKLSNPLRSLSKFSRSVSLSRPQPSECSREAPSPASVLRDSSMPAGGS